MFTYMNLWIAELQEGENIHICLIRYIKHIMFFLIIKKNTYFVSNNSDLIISYNTFNMTIVVYYSRDQPLGLSDKDAFICNRMFYLALNIMTLYLEV